MIEEVRYLRTLTQQLISLLSIRYPILYEEPEETLNARMPFYSSYSRPSTYAISKPSTDIISVKNARMPFYSSYSRPSTYAISKPSTDIISVKNSLAKDTSDIVSVLSLRRALRANDAPTLYN